jgi:hypothetical protein
MLVKSKHEIVGRSWALTILLPCWFFI